MVPLTHVLFDFFGTLVHYSPGRSDKRLDRSHAFVSVRSSQHTYEELAAQIEAVFEELEQRAARSLDEYGMDEVCTLFLGRVLGRAPSAEELTEFRETYMDEWNRGVRYIPGVQELLAELAGRFTLVLVTNTHNAPMVHRHLSAMGVAQHFSAVVASDQHGRRKPSPCIFERALALSGGAPETSLYVGDSFEADYRGAAGAGMRCLLIDPEERHAIAAADRLRDILALRAHLL